MSPVTLQEMNNIYLYAEASTEFQDANQRAEIKWSVTG